MATLGSYCKAYAVERFRSYPHWSEKQDNLRPHTVELEGDEVSMPRDLGDTDYLFLQENYVVTDSIFKDEYVIFDEVTPEWKEFCKNELEFPPADLTGVQAET